MATSPFGDTTFILEFLDNLNPATVLDVGAGFGRWGFLCRCHLGKGISLTVKPEQDLVIDAVEAFEPNVSPVYEAVYNHTFRGEAQKVVPGLGMYDVIICSHMIEHVEKDQGWQLIEVLKQHARMAVILGLPFRDPLRGPMEDNDYERHRAVWTADDFRETDAYTRSFKFIKKSDAGVVFYPLDENARWHVNTLRNPLRQFAVNKMPSALRFARRVLGRKKSVEERQ